MRGRARGERLNAAKCFRFDMYAGYHQMLEDR